MCVMLQYVYHSSSNLIIRATPPTSPQQAQQAARQAECEQCQMGSPPGHRQLVQPVLQLNQNIPNALLVCLGYIFAMYVVILIKIQHHPPVPVDQYPGIPCHQIEHHHVQRMHCLHSSSPPPPAQYYHPAAPSCLIPINLDLLHL